MFLPSHFPSTPPTNNSSHAMWYCLMGLDWNRLQTTLPIRPSVRPQRIARWNTPPKNLAYSCLVLNLISQDKEQRITFSWRSPRADCRRHSGKRYSWRATRPCAWWKFYMIKMTDTDMNWIWTPVAWPVLPFRRVFRSFGWCISYSPYTGARRRAGQFLLASMSKSLELLSFL